MDYRNLIEINKCSRCGYSEFKQSLHVHHIDNNHNNNDPSNLIVLCANCHMGLHRSCRHVEHRQKIQCKTQNMSVDEYLNFIAQYKSHMWVSKDSDNYKFMLSRDILFYDMMYFAGMNITELVDITIDDIDIENNTVCTKNKQYKIQKNVLEKLNAYILNWDIKSYIFKRGTNSDTHITRQSVNKKLKNFSEKTDLDISPINLKRLNYSKN